MTDSDSNDSSSDENDSENDNEGVLQLLPRRDNDDGNTENTDNTGNEEVVVGRMEAKDWMRVTQENLCAGRRINSIPYTPREGDGELFDVKIADKQLKGLIDKNRDLGFH